MNMKKCKIVWCVGAVKDSFDYCVKHGVLRGSGKTDLSTKITPSQKNRGYLNRLIAKPVIKEKKVRTWKDCDNCGEEFTSLHAITCPDCVRKRGRNKKSS